MRITESQLKRVIEKLVKEQAAGTNRENPYVTFAAAVQPGGDDNKRLKSAAKIRSLAGPGFGGWLVIVNGLTDAGVDEADAEEYANGILRKDY